jgi:hypothetical protein
MAYLGFSSLGAIATALHTKHIILSNNKLGQTHFNNLNGKIPHILDILE